MAAKVNTQSDVAVIGAGPVGLVLALLLARRGLSVSIYERWFAPYPLPRAIALNHETLRVLQATGHFEALASGIDIDVSRRLMPAYFAASGELLLSHPLQGDGFSFFPPMVLFHQPLLERALNYACASEPLISICRGWDARAVRQDDEFAYVTLAPVDGDQPRPGEAIEASARYIIGCDGANSTIRDLLGFEIVDTGFSESWLVIDIETTPEISEAIPFGQVLNPERPTSTLVSAHGRRRFEFMILPDDGPEISSEANVWRLIEPWGCTPENTQIVRSAAYTFRGRWAKTWRDGRFLLAGDAAHQMPPFLAQGLNSGLRDAAALPWRIEAICKGANPDLLDSYTSERLPHVRDIVEQAVTIGRIICTLDPDQAAARDAVLRRAQVDPSILASMMSGPPQQSDDDNGQVALAPPLRLGPGIGAENDPASRYVTIQGKISRDNETGLFDDVVGAGKFVLLSRESLHSRISDQARAVLDFVGAVTVSLEEDLVDVDGTYARWLEHLDAAAVLIRPDYYVFGAVDHADEVDALLLDLGRQIKMPLKG